MKTKTDVIERLKEIHKAKRALSSFELDKMTDIISTNEPVRNALNAPSALWGCRDAAYMQRRYNEEQRNAAIQSRLSPFNTPFGIG